MRGTTSLRILERHLSSREWLCGSSPTIADVACFPYVALAPMGDISLEPYPAVRRWIARFKTLPGYLDMPGLEDPNYRKAVPKTGSA
jgi:glutathione S-transferase